MFKKKNKKLGTSKKPAVVRVQSQERAEEILALSEKNGWKVIVGIEEDKEENISDFNKLLNSPIVTEIKLKPSPSQNSPCSCGSGKKYKRCCAAKS